MRGITEELELPPSGPTLSVSLAHLHHRLVWQLPPLPFLITGMRHTSLGEKELATY